MSYAPELEVLDQLLGGPMPLQVIAGLFPNREHCHRAISAMLKDGQIEILDREGHPLPFWHFREESVLPGFRDRGTGFQAEITEKGADMMG